MASQTTVVFLSLLFNPVTKDHYVKKDWLVDPKTVILASLHIKLGQIKNFVKVMYNLGEGLKYLKAIQLSDV